MLEKILGMTINTTVTDLAALAALTSIIVQVLKHIIPSKFPTKALVVIVAVFVTVLASVMFYGVMLKAFGIGILSGFVVAFISMEGFDSLKSIWNRFTIKTNANNIEQIEELGDSDEDIVDSYGVIEDFIDEPEYDNWDDAVGEDGGES